MPLMIRFEELNMTLITGTNEQNIQNAFHAGWRAGLDSERTDGQDEHWLAGYELGQSMLKIQENACKNYAMAQAFERFKQFMNAEYV